MTQRIVSRPQSSTVERRHGLHEQNRTYGSQRGQAAWRWRRTFALRALRPDTSRLYAARQRASVASRQRVVALLFTALAFREVGLVGTTVSRRRPRQSLSVAVSWMLATAAGRREAAAAAASAAAAAVAAPAAAAAAAAGAVAGCGRARARARARASAGRRLGHGAESAPLPVLRHDTSRLQLTFTER